ncbi:MAG: UvrD-helicase domain-containing protein [Anaerolineales bacterium]|nr:UvrD-helicase domain-containing protein [Anaerolineales bacterium]
MLADDLHHNLNGILQFLQTEHGPSSHLLAPSPQSGREGDEKSWEDLDPNQTLAATHLYGPMRVMAPAGSGKTRTLVSRIAFLLGQGIAPERILALAFNRKAQQEMQERLAALGHTINVRTFHSFGYEIVRRGLGWTYHENSHARLLELFRPHLNLPAEAPESPESLEVFLTLHRRATMELVPLRELRLPDNRPYQPIFETVLAAQNAQQLLTFDGMLYFALRVLLDDAALRHELQNQFEFVLVDEFQDLNHAQMLLTRILALPQNNLFVVGDDDQMIYGWRGADVRLILDFPQTFPEAKTVVLGTNYRSAGNIVRHSRMLIEHNPERVAKDIQPRPGAENGPLDVILASGIRQQAKAALDWMEAQKTAHGLEWDAFAILYRANSYILPLLPLLKQRGIPYTLAQEAAETDEAPEIQPGAVTLLTIHKSKGKEFPFVVYFNLNWSGGRDGETSVPEERRVAYVGATRAQRGLLLTADEALFSPFLVELTLNPAFADFAMPYLERQRDLARQKKGHLLRKHAAISHPGRFSFWGRFFQGGRDNSARITTLEAQLAEVEARLKAFETEIRYRNILYPKNEPNRKL